MTGHIEQLAARGKRRVCEVWILGQRKFPTNFIIRRQMFVSLVQPEISDGCEIFGRQKYEEFEKVQRKYFKWTLSFSQATKTDLLMEEAQLIPMHIIMGRRAMRYEEKAVHSPSTTLRECVRLLQSGGTNRYSIERANYCHDGGYSEETVSVNLKNGISMAVTLATTHFDAWMQIVGCNLKGSTYEVIWCPNALPKYLTTGSKYDTLARFRLENEEQGHQSWRTNPTCRYCGKEEDTLEHIVKKSHPIKGGVQDILNQDGRGIVYLNEIRKIIKK